MKTKLLFTKKQPYTLCALLVFCLCFNYGWAQELVQNGTCDLFTVTSTLATDNSWTRNDTDNADAFDMTPNNTVIFDAEAMSGPSGATSASPFQAVWDNDALEDWLEVYYLGAAGSLDEQPGSTSSGRDGTKGVKLYMDTSPNLPGQSSRRIYQKVEGLTIGLDYTFSVDSKADVDTTPDSEVYLLNTEIVDEVALNIDGGVAAGIRDDYIAVPASTSWATFSTTFTATNNFVVIYVRSLGAVDGSTETFWDNFSLQEDTTASVNDELASNFKVFPNPIKDVLTIDSNNIEVASVKIYDILGKQVFTQRGLDSKELNISHLNSGIYVLRIDTLEGALNTKIVVE